jgi:Ser/Thr protein kinase RdoA (MazF antagonist)
MIIIRESAFSGYGAVLARVYGLPDEMTELVTGAVGNSLFRVGTSAGRCAVVRRILRSQLRLRRNQNEFFERQAANRPARF